MKRSKRTRSAIIALSIVSLITIIASSVLYINIAKLPARINTLIVNSLSKETGKRVSVDSIRFSIFKGMVIKDLQIREPAEGSELFLRAGEISFNYLIFPLFRRRVIIPSLRIRDLDMVIKNDAGSGEWNFSSIALFTKQRRESDIKRYPLLIYKIFIEDGRLRFTDNLRSPVLTKNLKNVKADATLTPSQIRFVIRGDLEQKQDGSPLTITGSYAHRRRKVKLAAKSKGFSIKELSGYYNALIPLESAAPVDLEAEMAIEVGKALSAELKVDIEDQVVFIKADIKNFKFPVLEAGITSEINLKRAEPTIKNMLSENMKEGFALDGTAKLDIALTDTMNDERAAVFHSSVELREASMRIAPLTEKIEGINGKLRIGNDLVATRDLRLNFMDRSYVLGGSFKNFARPEIAIALESGDLAARGLADINEGNAHIKKVKLTYKRSSATFTGYIYDIRNPDLNIYGKCDFDTADIMSFAAQRLKPLKDVSVKGRGAGDIFIGGDPSDPSLMEIGIKLKSDEIKVNELGVQNIDLNLVSKNGKLNVDGLDMELYGGTLNIIYIMNLKSRAPAYDLTGHLRGLRIEELVKDTKLKGSGIYGDLSSSLTLNGIRGKPESVTGKGWIHAKEAHLGPLPIFIPVVSSLVDFLGRVVPGYKKIMLKEATGTFTVAEKKIVTDDLILWGDEASVLYGGSMGFDGSLDFRVENNFVEGLVNEKTDAGQSLSKFITGMGSFISEARLTGTIKKPKYEFKALPFKEFFKDKLKDFFQNILR